MDWLGDLLLLFFRLFSNYGVAVIVFALILRTVMLPLDFWQKSVMRKNAKAQKAMKPQMDALKKEVGDNQAALFQGQRAIQKQHGFSMLGSCLPMLATMAVMILMMTGFRAAGVSYNQQAFLSLQNFYNVEYNIGYYEAARADIASGEDVLVTRGENFLEMREELAAFVGLDGLGATSRHYRNRANELRDAFISSEFPNVSLGIPGDIRIGGLSGPQQAAANRYRHERIMNDDFFIAARDSLLTYEDLAAASERGRDNALTDAQQEAHRRNLADRTLINTEAARQAVVNYSPTARNRIISDPYDEEGRSRIVVRYLTDYHQSFLWITNIFMPDVPWVNAIPTWEQFAEGGFFTGGMSITITGLTQSEYEQIMSPVMTYFRENRPAVNETVLNGFLIFPILGLALNFLMMKVNPQMAGGGMDPMGGAGGAGGMAGMLGGGMSDEQKAQQQKMQGKIMKFMMPGMFFFFAMTFNSALAIFFFISSLFQVGFNFIYNKVAKEKDVKEEEIIAETTTMRRSEYEAMKKKEEEERIEKERLEAEKKAQKILDKSNSKLK